MLTIRHEKGKHVLKRLVSETAILTLPSLDLSRIFRFLGLLNCRVVTRELVVQWSVEFKRINMLSSSLHSPSTPHCIHCSSQFSTHFFPPYFFVIVSFLQVLFSSPFSSLLFSKLFLFSLLTSHFSSFLSNFILPPFLFPELNYRKHMKELIQKFYSQPFTVDAYDYFKFIFILTILNKWRFTIQNKTEWEERKLLHFIYIFNSNFIFVV